MSGSWCMWCMSHPNDWKIHPAAQHDLWTMEKIKERKEQIDAGLLKEPSAIRGVVNNPIWDFIQPSNMVFPQLHIEIGLVNNVLDSFYLFIDDQVEAPTDEEKCSRNSYIVADVALTKAMDRLNEWKEVDAHNLEGHRFEASRINRELNTRGTINDIERTAARNELSDIQREIQTLLQEKKNLENNVKAMRAALQRAKKEHQSVRAKKKKMDMPIYSHVENILKEYNISAAAYHGGKLNGVDCCEFIRLAKPIFSRFQTQLLSVTHAGRCTDEMIVNACNLHCDICSMLDYLASKFRMKCGEPTENDYQVVEECLAKIHELWVLAGLNFTPKMHSMLNHGPEQMRRFGGIGDTLEDDVEHLHQMSARIESRVSRMKNKGQQAFVHSKIEVIQNCAAVKQHIEDSKMAAKRVIINRNQDLCAVSRAKRAKLERDEERAQTLTSLQHHNHSQVVRSHDERKAEMLRQND